MLIACRFSRHRPDQLLPVADEQHLYKDCQDRPARSTSSLTSPIRSCTSQWVRSPLDTTASTLPLSTIGRCRNRRLLINFIASSTVVVGGMQYGSFVITADTFVLRGSRPPASTLFSASRSVKMPISRSPSMTIRAPILPVSYTHL